jgi:hypothetical protein
MLDWLENGIPMLIIKKKKAWSGGENQRMEKENASPRKCSNKKRVDNSDRSITSSFLQASKGG